MKGALSFHAGKNTELIEDSLFLPSDDKDGLLQ